MVAWGRSWDGLGWVVLWDGRDGRDGVFPFPSFVASRDQRLSLPACHRGCEHRALFWAGPRLRYPAASCVTPSPPNSPCLVDFARLCSQNRQHGPAQTPRSALRPSRPFQKGCVEILTHAPCPLMPALRILRGHPRNRPSHSEAARLPSRPTFSGPARGAVYRLAYRRYARRCEPP